MFLDTFLGLHFELYMYMYRSHIVYCSISNQCDLTSIYCIFAQFLDGEDR